MFYAEWYKTGCLGPCMILRTLLKYPNKSRYRNISSLVSHNSLQFKEFSSKIEFTFLCFASVNSWLRSVMFWSKLHELTLSIHQQC